MALLQPLKLLLPALIPSWNFFDVIAPSPRIQFLLLNSKEGESLDWLDFRPRPQKLSIVKSLQRLFYNASWNESLFLVSCAERIIQNAPDQQTSSQKISNQNTSSQSLLHSEQEIVKRLRLEIQNNKTLSESTYFRFRLLFLQRQGSAIEETVHFVSATYPLARQESEA